MYSSLYLYYILGFEQVNGRFYCHKILDFTFNGTPRINEMVYVIQTIWCYDNDCIRILLWLIFSNMSKREKK